MKQLRLAVAALILLVPRSGWTQEPVQPPPRDTLRQPTDSLPSEAVIQDTVRPIPVLATHYFAPALGLGDGVWVWDQSNFLLEATTSLSDLLERIPGILTVRSGLLVQPEAAAVYGGTANRLELYLDGFAIDPLTESSVDLTKMELVHIDNVRIERRMGLIRIYIQTIAPADTRAYTRVEAGIGEPESNLFRGILLAPKLFFGPFGVAIDRMDTDGQARREPGDQFAGWIKWAFIRGQSGLQVQFRRVSTDRDDDVPWAAEHTRDDVIAQLRLHLRDGLVAELFGGRSTFEADTIDPPEAADTFPKINESALQYGGILSFTSRVLWARGSARVRDHETLPSLQLDGAAGIRLSDRVAVSGEVTQADWRASGTATWYSVQGSLMPIRGIRAFGEFTAGTRGAPNIYGLSDVRAFINEQNGYRAGAEISWRGFQVAAAYLHTESDSSAVFGLPFDTSGGRTFNGASAEGWEISGHTAAYRGFSAYGMATNWLSGFPGLLVPVQQFRAGLQLHASPMKSGNLELYGRIEGVRRSSMTVPTGLLPANTTIDAYAQIRIIDVRLFGRFEDITGQGEIEVEDRLVTGPRIFYGVKWQFWN
jgi:hypothetical protein